METNGRQRLNPRRSNGEKELHDLTGKSLLLTKDPAFHPAAQGLEWRIQKTFSNSSHALPTQ